MNNFKLSSSLLLLFICLTVFEANGASCRNLQDAFSAYTGKYQAQQPGQTVFADVYVEKGKLTAKSTTGQVLTLDHVGGDDFKITSQNLPVKFIRDKNNKVFEIMVNGSIAWTRADNNFKTLTTEKTSFNANDFLGKYQITVNSQVLKIEVSLKNGALYATQLWDGGASTLDFVSADHFNVSALSMPLGFIRDKHNQVVQLLLNNHDLFTKTLN
jgi:hypothetical protein